MQEALEVRVPPGTSYPADVHTTIGSSDVSVQQDPASSNRIEVRTDVGAVEVSNL